MNKYKLRWWIGIVIILLWTGCGQSQPNTADLTPDVTDEDITSPFLSPDTNRIYVDYPYTGQALLDALKVSLSDLQPSGLAYTLRSFYDNHTQVSEHMTMDGYYKSMYLNPDNHWYHTLYDGHKGMLYHWSEATQSGMQTTLPVAYDLAEDPYVSTEDGYLILLPDDSTLLEANIVTFDGETCLYYAYTKGTDRVKSYISTVSGLMLHEAHYRSNVLYRSITLEDIEVLEGDLPEAMRIPDHIAFETFEP